ncbi:uncharacterized protein LOC110430385 [Sorghum bicolor]|uniref:uncharacterized protein LOC110430385 n=1 Tax=Sorghum bicolor TaxID=4558 RepID=UPI000B42526D|nr:uncharacterized protein LOC110430385 [Sorghum bicolor]|eukprot:XP_021303719.1 uncharacterized protein LOC110430385 [Sorghum bicolor]
MTEANTESQKEIMVRLELMLEQEEIHWIKKKQGKKGLCAGKLDMHKAYDRVEWGFLEKIMLKMGFDRRWVSLIMACVKSVRYKVRVNASETGLSSLLKGAENRADNNNAEVLKDLLARYCANSGQKISDAKSSIFFSPNTDVDTKAEVCETLNILTESLTDKYLGLPALVGVDRSDCFQYLVDRVRGKTKDQHQLGTTAAGGFGCCMRLPAGVVVVATHALATVRRRGAAGQPM